MGDRAEQSDERETGAGDPLTDATTSLPTLQLAAEVRSADTMSSALDDLCRLLNGGSCEVDHCSTIKRDGGVDAVAHGDYLRRISQSAWATVCGTESDARPARREGS